MTRTVVHVMLFSAWLINFFDDELDRKELIPLLPPFLFGLIILPSRSLKARLFSPFISFFFYLLRGFVTLMFRFCCFCCCCCRCNFCKPENWESKVNEMLDKLEEKPSITTEVAKINSDGANEKQQHEVLEMQQLSAASSVNATDNEHNASSAICFVTVKDEGNDEEDKQMKGTGNN